MKEDWTDIYETDRPYLAEMIRGLLESNGIDAVVLNQKDSSYHFGTVRVKVRTRDARQAETIIQTADGK